MLSPDQVDRLEEKRSKDTAAIFLGWFLIVSGCFFILFLDWDRRGGTSMMEIMFAMRDMTPGQTLLVTAYDPAAAGDIAAWCRMTGNTLVKTLPDLSGKQFLLKKGQ